MKPVIVVIACAALLWAPPGEASEAAGRRIVALADVLPTPGPLAFSDDARACKFYGFLSFSTETGEWVMSIDREVCDGMARGIARRVVPARIGLVPGRALLRAGDPAVLVGSR